MSSPRRSLTIASFLLALAAVALYFLCIRNPGAVARFHDGSTVRLLGVTVGTNSFIMEPWWHPLARRFLPRSPRSRYAPTFASGPGGYTNGIRIWLQCSGPLAGGPTQKIKSEFIDEFGDVVHDLFPSVSSIGNNGLGVVTTTCFPRRQSSFLLRLSAGTNQPPVELSVPNPIHGPFPEWKPEQLPVTKTNGDLVVTFKGLKKKLQYLPWYPPFITNVHLIPEFECAWKGAVTSDWILSPGVMEDATGNWIGGTYPGLPSHESAWKLALFCWRKSNATFGADERISLGNLPVPGDGTVTTLNNKTNLQGVTVWVLGWAGAGTVILSNGIPISAKAQHTSEPYRQLTAGYTNFETGWNKATWMETINLGRPTLFLAHSYGGLGLQVTPLFRDSQSHSEVAPLNTTGFSPDPHGARSNALHGCVQPALATNMVALSAEIIVQHAREFEFYAAPPTNYTWLGRPPDKTP